MKSLKAISQQWRNSPLYALQSCQFSVTRHTKSLGVEQASGQFRWQRICYGASSPIYLGNMSFLHLTGGEIGLTTALSI